jgi:hypothetical protein
MANLLNIGMNTGPQQPEKPEGFLSTVGKVAGVVAPILEAAAAFKRGYQSGLPLPGASSPRMAGDAFMLQVLQDMRQRNEAAAERSRGEREEARKSDLRTKVLMEAYRNKEISLEDLMKNLGAGELTSIAVKKPTSVISEEKPAEEKPAEEAPNPPLERTSVEPPETPKPSLRYGREAIPPEYRGVI